MFFHCRVYDSGNTARQCSKLSCFGDLTGLNGVLRKPFIDFSAPPWCGAFFCSRRRFNAGRTAAAPPANEAAQVAPSGRPQQLGSHEGPEAGLPPEPPAISEPIGDRRMTV